MQTDLLRAGNLSVCTQGHASMSHFLQRGIRVSTSDKVVSAVVGLQSVAKAKEDRVSQYFSGSDMLMWRNALSE